ncbi:MAG: NUDIX hydrolase [Balneolales bacterium]
MLHKLVERKIASKKVFSGKLLHVYKDTVRLPNGKTSTREWVKHPGASAVLPVFENGDVMLVKQFRYPLSQIFYEVPAGKIDPGEPPGITSCRELEEETGLVCEHMAYVGHFHPAIGFSDEIIYLYAAWGLNESRQNFDPDEFLQLERMPLHEAVAMIENGQITDGKTMACIYRALSWWHKHTPFPLNMKLQTG